MDSSPGMALGPPEASLPSDLKVEPPPDTAHLLRLEVRGFLRLQKLQRRLASARLSAANPQEVDLFSFPGKKYSSVSCSQIQFGEDGNEERRFKSRSAAAASDG